MSEKSKEKRLRPHQYPEERFIIIPSNLEKVYLFIIRWGIYLVLFTPLIFSNSFVFPFAVPKTIFFRILVDIIFVAYILLVFSNSQYKPKFNALTVAISLFLGILILTSFTGVNFERSFWGYFERMGGLLTFFHLFVFFIILSSVFKERRDWERILTCSILVGVLLVLYILLSDKISIKGGGTIGNTSFMAAYLLFNIFFALILFLTKGGRWRIFYGVTLVILLPVLLTSTCRGAIGAFFSGILLFGLGYILFLHWKLLKRLVLVMILGLIILGGIGIFHFNFGKNKIAEFRNIPTLQARLVVWQTSWQSWKKRFWLGWGLENFEIPFYKYFDPRLTLTQYGRSIPFDKAHNIIFDVGVTSGLFGLLSYLAIFVISLFGLLRACQKALNREGVILLLGIAVLLVVYFLQNLFVFDMISTYMMFFLTLALVNYLLKEEGVKEELIKKPLSPLLEAVLIIITVFTLYFGNIRLAEASWYTARVIASPLENAISFYQKTLKTLPTSQWEVRGQFAQQVSQTIFYPEQNKKTLEEGLQLAEEEMKKSIKKNPLVFQLYLTQGKFYNKFFKFSGSKEKLELARTALQKAIELSPKNQEGYWELAHTRFLEKKYGEAFDLLQKAIDLEPQLAPSHWYLAIAYKSAGQSELAEKKIREIKKITFNWRGKLAELKSIIMTYKNWGDYSTVVFLCQEGLKANPKAPWFWLRLAEAHLHLGEKGKAKETAEKAREFAPIIAPEIIPEIERFLESLRK